ncbi:Ribonuclease H-like superfamily [Sesbania bispinosa]|nr:Ribonuclease H-like superfamily [Sesbania bispinosa]
MDLVQFNHGKDLLRREGKWLIADGTKVDIRKDIWLHSGVKARVKQESNLQLVGDLVDPVNGSWNIQAVRMNIEADQIQEVLKTPVAWTSQEDQFIWPHTTNGEYSVRILPVKEELHMRRIAQDPKCPICKQENEPVEHMFLLCDWTRPIWFGSTLQHIPDRSTFTDISSWLRERVKIQESNQDRGLADNTLLACILWNIWKERNSVIFQETKPNPKVVLIRANSLFRDCGCINAETSNQRDSNNTRKFPAIWRPPRQGLTKINTDVAFNSNTGGGSTTCIARNSKGEMEFGHTSSILAPYALMAEALALREAISIAKNLGLRDIVLESDSKDLIQACWQEKDKGEIRVIVPREVNGAAHVLAKLASQAALGRGWSLRPPPQLQAVLCKDMQSTHSSLQRS